MKLNSGVYIDVQSFQGLPSRIHTFSIRVREIFCKQRRNPCLREEWTFIGPAIGAPNREGPGFEGFWAVFGAKKAVFGAFGGVFAVLGLVTRDLSLEALGGVADTRGGPMVGRKSSGIPLAKWPFG